MCKAGKSCFFLVGFLLLGSLPAMSQDVEMARTELDWSLSLLTVFEQNWLQREALSFEREKNLNEIELSLLAREALLNENERQRTSELDAREKRLSETESSLQKREQTQNEIESSLLRVQNSFDSLEGASKKLEKRFNRQRGALRLSLLGLLGFSAYELGRALLR